LRGATSDKWPKAAQRRPTDDRGVANGTRWPVGVGRCAPYWSGGSGARPTAAVAMRGHCALRERQSDKWPTAANGGRRGGANGTGWPVGVSRCVPYWSDGPESRPTAVRGHCRSGQRQGDNVVGGSQRRGTGPLWASRSSRRGPWTWPDTSRIGLGARAGCPTDLLPARLNHAGGRPGGLEQLADDCGAGGRGLDGHVATRVDTRRAFVLEMWWTAARLLCSQAGLARRFCERERGGDKRPVGLRAAGAFGHSGADTGKRAPCRWLGGGGKHNVAVTSGARFFGAAGAFVNSGARRPSSSAA